MAIASAVALLLMLAAVPSQAAVRRAVVVLAGGLSIRDIADPHARNLANLLDHGSSGLMNIRTGKPTKDTEVLAKPGLAGGCLSLGSGAMASGGAEVARAFNAQTSIGTLTAADMYLSRTMRKAPAASVVHTEIEKMNRINSTAAYRARPGALGDALRALGIRIAVFGNSDVPEQAHREAVASAMDSSGLVDAGDVDSPGLVLPDAQFAYGLRVNDADLFGNVASVLRTCRLVFVDFGDTYRADDYARFCTDEQAAVLRERTVRNLDDLVGRLSAILDPSRDLLVVLSPCAREMSDIEEERLAPVVMRGPGFGGGLLRSPSTRRRGVVTIADIAPTLISSFGGQPPHTMTGRPLEFARASNAIPFLLKTNLRASNQAQRQVAMRGSSVVQSIVVVLVTAGLLMRKPGSSGKLLLWLAVVPPAIPLAMLYMPLIYQGGLAGSVAVLTALTLALVVLCAVVLKKPMRALAWLCAAVVVSLAVDLLRGSPLIGASIAGYGVVEGARYYGIGNELMGTMIGAITVLMGCLLAAGLLPRKLAGAAATGVFGLTFVFIGAPNLGANAGGAMAAAPAATAALLGRRGWRPNLSGIGQIALVTVVLVGALFAIDGLRGGEAQSHVGRMLASGGVGGMLPIFQRKLAMNFMLLSTSLWSRLLGLCLLCSALMLWSSWRRLGKSLLPGEWYGAGMGCLVGALAAYAFNDSGVVAAATCVVIGWSMVALRYASQQT